MKIDNKNKTMLLLLFFMALVAIIRVFMSLDAEVIPVMSNFSPLGAMALFGGRYFKKTSAFIFPLLTLWVSDIFLNRFLFFDEWVLFYDGFLWTYDAFALMVVVGKYALKKVNVSSIIGSSLLIVLIHWIVTDISPWLANPIYPNNLLGYWMALVAALPFERNLLVGTLVYSAVMFGSFEYIRGRYLLAVPQPI